MTISSDRFNTTDVSDAYPDPKVLEYMEHQSRLFDERRSQLLKQYLGDYVWFEDGQVLDADKDHAALVMRAYGATGPRPLFVRKVLPEDPHPSVRTPFYHPTF